MSRLHPNMRIKGRGNSMGRSNDQQNKSLIKNDDINKILNLSSDNIGTLIKKASELAKEFEYIPASKLRDFYDYVVQIEESDSNEWYLKLMLLKPKMTYQASKETDKRNKKPALEMLEKEFSKMLNKIKQIIASTDSFLFKKFRSKKIIKILENIKEAKINGDNLDFYAKGYIDFNKNYIWRNSWYEMI